MQDLKRLFGYFSPYKKDLFLASIALGATAFAILFFGKIAKIFIDSASYDASFFLIFLSLVFVLAFSGYVRSYLINSICTKVSNNLRQDIYKNSINMSAHFFKENKIGDIISRISEDVNQVSEIVSGNVAFFLRNLIVFTASLILLFLISFKLSLIVFSLIFLAILPIFICAKSLKKNSTKSKESFAKIISQVEESLSAVRTIQAYGAQNQILTKFNKLSNADLKSNFRRIKLKSFLVAVTIFFAFLAIALILIIGAEQVLDLKITKGEFSSFVFYAVIASISLVGLSQISSQVQILKSSLVRIFSLLDASSEIIEQENCAILSDEKVDIRFEKVDFYYEEKVNFQVLKNFNLEIKSGQKVLIYGKSGAGKSTILNLLLRFYDVCQGAILFNEANIKNLSLEDLRSKIAYVSQDNFIFSGTVFENIIFSNPNFSRQKIEEIIASNSAFSFVNSMPKGLDSEIGEKGAKLSGGQKQRIAILRALIKNSQILLFDEGTSALDKESEVLILQLVEKFSQGKTLVMVAHKLPEVINFDFKVEI